MKLNPCSKCKCTDIINNGKYVYCTNVNCDSDIHTTVGNWNKANSIDAKLTQLQQAACKSLMQRYGVDGKMAEADLPDYDRRLAHMLVDEGVLSLANGLYSQK